MDEKLVTLEKFARYDEKIKSYISDAIANAGLGGTDTSDATATEDKVFLNETFYAGGQKRTGTFTIESEVNSQNELIASIKSALEGKTAGSGGDTLKTLLDATKSTYYFFRSYAGTSVEGLIPYSATENVTNMDHMFTSCSNLVAVPLFNTSNVTDMRYMFTSCAKLPTAPSFDTSKVTTTEYMFYNCKSLTAASFSNVGNVANMWSMFENGYALKKVVLGQISSKTTNTTWWFRKCSSLELVDFRGATGVPTLTGTSSFESVPSTCKVVIPDALYDAWTTATNWSAINVTWVRESEYTEE